MIDRGEKLNDYFTTIADDDINLVVYWLRPVCAESESLLTSRIKHSFFEMQYVMSGQVTVRLADGESVITAGRFMLIPPSCYHEIIAYDNETQKLVFAFDIQMVDAELNESFHKIAPQTVDDSSVMRQIVETLLRVGSSGAAFANVQVKCLTEALFFELFHTLIPIADRRSFGNRKIKACQKQEFSKHLMQCINESMGSGFVTVSELADRLHISVRQLDRLCVQTLEKTPKEFIDGERLKYIKKMLSLTECSLAEIAVMSGFSSEYALIRFFKQKEGYTPGEYRKYTTM